MTLNRFPVSLYRIHPLKSDKPPHFARWTAENRSILNGFLTRLLRSFALVPSLSVFPEHIQPSARPDDTINSALLKVLYSYLLECANVNPLTMFDIDSVFTFVNVLKNAGI